MGKRNQVQREERMPYTGRDLKKRDLEKQETRDVQKEQHRLNNEQRKRLGHDFGHPGLAKKVTLGKIPKGRRSRRSK